MFRSMRHLLNAPTALGLTLAVFIAVTWIGLGLTFVIIVFLPTIVAFVAWLKTTYPYPVKSERVVIVYLFAIAVQFVHLSEEFINRFWDYYNVMFVPPIPWDERFFTVLFIIAFPLLFVLGAIGLLAHNPLGNYLAWWFALGPNMANFVAHLAFPFIYGGYVPGLWTAPLHGAMSLVLLHALVVQHRENLRVARQESPALVSALPRTVQ
jgi:hypothetical protein